MTNSINGNFSSSQEQITRNKSKSDASSLHLSEMQDQFDEHNELSLRLSQRDSYRNAPNRHQLTSRSISSTSYSKPILEPTPGASLDELKQSITDQPNPSKERLSREYSKFVALTERPVLVKKPLEGTLEEREAAFDPTGRRTSVPLRALPLSLTQRQHSVENSIRLSRNPYSNKGHFSYEPASVLSATQVSARISGEEATQPLKTTSNSSDTAAPIAISSSNTTPPISSGSFSFLNPLASLIRRAVSQEDKADESPNTIRVAGANEGSTTVNIEPVNSEELEKASRREAVNTALNHKTFWQRNRTKILAGIIIASLAIIPAIAIPAALSQQKETLPSVANTTLVNNSTLFNSTTPFPITTNPFETTADTTEITTTQSTTTQSTTTQSTTTQNIPTTYTWNNTISFTDNFEAILADYNLTSTTEIADALLSYIRTEQTSTTLFGTATIDLLNVPIYNIAALSDVLGSLIDANVQVNNQPVQTLLQTSPNTNQVISDLAQTYTPANLSAPLSFVLGTNTPITAQVLYNDYANNVPSRRRRDAPNPRDILRRDTQVSEFTKPKFKHKRRTERPYTAPSVPNRIPRAKTRVSSKARANGLQ